jgi:hypothetical protein
MRHKSILLLVLVFAIGATASVALGASPHFKKGGTPKCTISGSGDSRTTTCTGSITGLGGGDVTITTIISGSAVYQCQNNGGNIAPGQNKVLVGPSTEPTTIPSGEIKNGNLTFTTDPNTLSADDTVSGSTAGCPGNNWTGVNPTLTITSIELKIAQNGVFYDCTVSDPNGLSGTVSFPASC